MIEQPERLYGFLEALDSALTRVTAKIWGPILACRGVETYLVEDREERIEFLADQFRRINDESEIAHIQIATGSDLGVYAEALIKAGIVMDPEVKRLMDGMGIEMISPPKGSPSHIAEAWVGCTIPFSSDIPVPPMVFGTPEMYEAGMTSSDDRFYVVSSPVAVSALQEHNPHAAEVFKNYMPESTDENHVLIFDSDCCEVVGVV